MTVSIVIFFNLVVGLNDYDVFSHSKVVTVLDQKIWKRFYREQINVNLKLNATF